MNSELTPFLALHFRGSRFDTEAGMPVDALGELVAYRELVIEVARSLFLQQNPDRKRVPKGFADRLQLRLRRVDEGSSVPVLERPSPSGTLDLPDEFGAARDVISDAIEAAAQNVSIPATFPGGALVYFNRLGQGLSDDESIEFRSPQESSGPRYTQQTRKTLLAGQMNYQRDTTVLGWVTEVDAELMRFQLRRVNAPAISARIDAVTFDEVKSALAPTGEGPQVSVSGVGVFDRHDVLVRFDSVHELTFEDAADALSDAVTAAVVDEGWFDGDGSATDPEVVRRAQALLAAIVASGAPQPRVFPVPDGGVQAEWTVGDREISVAVEPGGGLYVVSVDVSSGASEDASLAEDDPAPVLRLVLPDAS